MNDEIELADDDPSDGGRMLPKVMVALSGMDAQSREELVERLDAVSMELALPENRNALELVARAILVDTALKGDDDKVRISAAKEILASYRVDVTVKLDLHAILAEIPTRRLIEAASSGLEIVG